MDRRREERTGEDGTREEKKEGEQANRKDEKRLPFHSILEEEQPELACEGRHFLRSSLSEERDKVEETVCVCCYAD